MGFQESRINELLHQSDLIQNGTEYKDVKSGKMYRITGNNLNGLTSSVGNNMSKHQLKRDYIIYTLTADDGSTTTAYHGELKDQQHPWRKNTFLYRRFGVKLGGKRKTRKLKKSKRKHTRKSKKTNKKRRSTRRR
jgi:hypothetical protein